MELKSEIEPSKEHSLQRLVRLRAAVREYDFGHGITVRPRRELDGVVCAMGDTEPCFVKVFDVFHGGKLRATAETWEQAKDMAFSIRIQPNK